MRAAFPATVKGDALGGKGSCGQGKESSGAATNFPFRDRPIRASDGDV